MLTRATPLALLALTAATGGSAWAATDYGTVISTTPVIATTPVTQRDCVVEPGAAPASRGNSGAGAIAGAVVGAALGNALGGGTGRAMATGIGMIAGAALGNHAEAEEAARTAAPVQRCRDVVRQEQRVVGYDVVYDYQGVQRSVRLPQPPGDRIALEVSVVPVGQVGAPAQPPAPAPAAAPRVYRTPADNPYADDVPPVRTVYVPAPAPETVVVERPVYASPWPYLLVGGVAAWAIANGHHGGHGGRYWRHR